MARRKGKAKQQQQGAKQAVNAGPARPKRRPGEENPEIKLRVDFDGDKTATINLDSFNDEATDFGLFWNDELVFQDNPDNYPTGSPPTHEYSKTIQVRLRAFTVNNEGSSSGHVFKGSVTGNGKAKVPVTLTYI